MVQAASDIHNRAVADPRHFVGAHRDSLWNYIIAFELEAHCLGEWGRDKTLAGNEQVLVGQSKLKRMACGLLKPGTGDHGLWWSGGGSWASPRQSRCGRDGVEVMNYNARLFA